jgi:hypothetical protein
MMVGKGLSAMGQRKMRICRIVTTLIVGVLPLLPQPASAQKNIKVALALSRDVPGTEPGLLDLGAHRCPADCLDRREARGARRNRFGLTGSVVRARM